MWWILNIQVRLFLNWHFNRNHWGKCQELNLCQWKLLPTWVCKQSSVLVRGNSSWCVFDAELNVVVCARCWLSWLVNNWVWIGREPSLSSTCAQLEGRVEIKPLTVFYWHHKELKYICVLFSFLAQSVEQAKQAWPNLASSVDFGKVMQQCF